MPTVEERLAFLEGRVTEHTRAMAGIRDSVTHLEQRIAHLEERMDRRFEAMDRRFEAMDRRFESIDLHFAAIEDKMTRYFVWAVGIQVTALAAIVTAFVARR